MKKATWQELGFILKDSTSPWWMASHLQGESRWKPEYPDFTPVLLSDSAFSVFFFNPTRCQRAREDIDVVPTCESSRIEFGVVLERQRRHPAHWPTGAGGKFWTRSWEPEFLNILLSITTLYSFFRIISVILDTVSFCSPGSPLEEILISFYPFSKMKSYPK